MASSVDDDFSLLDDHQTNPNHQIVLHHHHPSYAPIQAPTPDNHDADDDSDSNFRGANFGNNNNATSSDVRIEKRRDQEEINDSGSKRHKQSTAEYRKDREEWSDAAIGCLLEAYLEKLTQLNRGNLRGRDWEEVAAAVTERYMLQLHQVLEVAVLIAREVAIACRLGVEVAIVVGGRNFFCGDSWVTATGLERSTAYQIG
ncbi:Aspartate/glutamate/uridylate kinase [Corchorus olitorius]|uniref:Aspartate/glutamate/uridylate kinase n=1 Tax=Corchorus olitorius TaxID=93759 RepID=A0A1R3IMZ7_9ROSI|nr:Aspartate/glutamate/uridylate kinase [Corchorus olitorius]